MLLRGGGRLEGGRGCWRRLEEQAGYALVVPKGKLFSSCRTSLLNNRYLKKLKGKIGEVWQIKIDEGQISP